MRSSQSCLPVPRPEPRLLIQTARVPSSWVAARRSSPTRLRRSPGRLDSSALVSQATSGVPKVFRRPSSRRYTSLDGLTWSSAGALRGGGSRNGADGSSWVSAELLEISWREPNSGHASSYPALTCSQAYRRDVRERLQDRHGD